jgi:hypothetical protein
MASTADFWSGWSPITLPFRCCLLFSAIFAFKFTSRIFYIVHASVKWFTLISRVVTFSCPKLVFFTKSQNIDDWTLEFSKEIVVSLLLTVGHKIHTSSPLRLVGAKWLDEASVERDAWTPPLSEISLLLLPLAWLFIRFGHGLVRWTDWKEIPGFHIVSAVPIDR